MRLFTVVIIFFSCNVCFDDRIDADDAQKLCKLLEFLPCECLRKPVGRHVCSKQIFEFEGASAVFLYQRA